MIWARNDIDLIALSFYGLVSYSLLFPIRVSLIPIFNHQWTPFTLEDVIFTGSSRENVMSLAYNAGDFLLAIDSDGVIRDVSGIPDYMDWLNSLRDKPMAETVLPDSLEKVANLNAVSQIRPHQERHINHHGKDGAFPVSYRFMVLEDDDWLLAIGKDLRELADLQQRTLMAQQVIERDYIHLRQTESRYRILFQSIVSPTLIINVKSRIIEQANSACENVFGVNARSLAKKDFLDLFETPSQHALLGYFGAVTVSDSVPPIGLMLAPSRGYSGTQEVRLAAKVFRQEKDAYFLVTLSGDMRAEKPMAAGDLVEAMVEQLPDSFVLTDEDLNICYANPEFVMLLNAYSAEQLNGMTLEQFVGRPAIDLNLLRREVDGNGSVRNFASIVHDVNGQTEQVEISAAVIEGEKPVYAFSMRNVGRRERDLSPTVRSELQSVDQLTGLVGRKSLKEIVRESTDLIESMCIQAALKHTAHNRANAAEILGVSRQSLYSKMRLYGLGNKDEDQSAD
jgi:transcriptional regulator PpsR